MVNSLKLAGQQSLELQNALHTQKKISLRTS